MEWYNINNLQQKTAKAIHELIKNQTPSIKTYIHIKNEEIHFYNIKHIKILIRPITQKISFGLYNTNNQLTPISEETFELLTNLIEQNYHHQIQPITIQFKLTKTLKTINLKIKNCKIGYYRPQAKKLLNNQLLKLKKYQINLLTELTNEEKQQLINKKAIF